MIAKSIKGGSTENIIEELNKITGDAFRPTLAIAFVSIYQDRQAIRQIFTERGIAIFGVTTNGAFLDDLVEKEKGAFLVMDLDPSCFTLSLAEYPARDFQQAAAGLARKAIEKIKHPSFLIAGTNTFTDAEQLLLGFEEIVGKNVNIYGCMAGDDFAFKEQFVFTNEAETNIGMVMLALDEDRVSIKGRATCGWNAVGTVRTVTKSEGNHVYTVDNIPVLELTAQYGGLELVPGSSSFSIEVASQLPLQLQRESGDPVMRPGLQIDWEDRSFYCSGSVPQGSKVRFSLPPDFDVIEKVIQACEDLKKNEIPEADALIIFSCAGRFIALGPLIGDEIEGMRMVWNVPMAGMFSNAELARATGGNLEMHNLTTCVVALKEK